MDAQNQGLASQRFYHGGKDGSGVNEHVTDDVWRKSLLILLVGNDDIPLCDEIEMEIMLNGGEG